MNKDDRAALADHGRQFCPKLFAKLDENSDDDVMLAAVGKGYAQLHARAEAAEAEAACSARALVQLKADLEALRSQPAVVASYGDLEPVADDQPSAAEVADWLPKQALHVTRQRVQLVAQPSGRRQRQYSSYEEPATLADVKGWRLKDDGLHLVLSDGKPRCLPWP